VFNFPLLELGAQFVLGVGRGNAAVVAFDHVNVQIFGLQVVHFERQLKTGANGYFTVIHEPE